MELDFNKILGYQTVQILFHCDNDAQYSVLMMLNGREDFERQSYRKTLVRLSFPFVRIFVYSIYSMATRKHRLHCNNIVTMKLALVINGNVPLWSAASYMIPYSAYRDIVHLVRLCNQWHTPLFIASFIY